MELHVLLLVLLTFQVLFTAAERNDASSEEGDLQLTAQTGKLLELALRNSLRKNAGVYAVLLQQDNPSPERNPMAVQLDPAEFKQISDECLDCDGLCWQPKLSKCFKLPAYRCAELGGIQCKGEIKDPQVRVDMERLVAREHQKKLDCDDCWGRCWENVSKTCHQLIPSKCDKLPNGKFCPGKAPLKDEEEMQLQEKAHDLIMREKEIAAAKRDLEVSPELDEKVKKEVEAIRKKIENQNGTLTAAPGETAAATPGETQDENDPKAHPVRPEEWYEASHPDLARAKKRQSEHEQRIEKEEEELKQKQQAKGVPENKQIDKKIEEDEQEEKQEAEQAKEKGMRTVEAIRESASVRMAYPSQILAVLLSLGLSQLLSRSG